MISRKRIYSAFLFRILPFIAISFMLTACPYKSEVPISTSGVEVPSYLIGKWIEKVDEMPDYPDCYDFSKGPGNTFFIKITDIETDSNDMITDTVYTYRYGHFSKIDGELFMNLSKEYSNPITSFDSEYSLYRLISKSGRTYLYGLSPYIGEKFDTSEELAAFIEKYMYLTFFYESTNGMEFIKKENQ